MQEGLAYLAYVAVFQLLSGVVTQPKAPEKAKIPDQAKLQGYLERCEKTLNKSWLIEGKYSQQLTRSSEILYEQTGHVLLLRVPFLPEVYLLQSAEKGTGKNPFFIFHLGQFRLCVSRNFHDIGFDLPLASLHVDWYYTDSIWKGHSRGLLIWGPSGSYNVNFDLRAPLIRRENGWLQGLFEKYIVSRGPLGLLLGMDAKQTVKRFEIKLTKDSKEYLYVEAFPRTPDDKILFVRAQVVFDKNTFLPRRLWYAEADKDTNTYNLTKMLTIP